MLSVYAEVADDVYAQIAQRFDDLGENLAAAMNLVDVEADAKTMVDAPDRDRRAWPSAEHHALRLDSLLPALIAAARLLTGLPTDRQEFTLLLACQVGDDLHRRRVWQAWTASGRWAAMLTLGGARITANRPAQNLKEYPQSRPYEEGLCRSDAANGRACSSTPTTENRDRPHEPQIGRNVAAPALCFPVVRIPHCGRVKTA